MRLYGSSETDVSCPSCGDGRLIVRIGCLSASVECMVCRAGFSLSELSRRLDPEGFCTLAEAVGNRASDRV